MDRTAPRLVASSPAADAVNVDGRTVRLSFSERIDAATALRAVRVTPEGAPGEAAPVVEASGDEIVVTLPALRDSTTYVVTVGTDLADRRGVKLPAPITLAFSTGPTLDRGALSGTVRLPTDGSGVGGLAVLAWRVSGDSLPDPRTDRPDARTETDAQGAFTLGYLRDTPHFVAALRDLNRNGRADDGEPFAAPPSPRLRPTLDAASPAPGDSLAPVPDLDAPVDSVVFPRPDVAATVRAASLDLWLTRLDTVPPRMVSVRALSNRRFRIRYDEGLRHPPSLYVTRPQAQAFNAPADSQIAQGSAYVVPGEPREIELWMDAPARPGSARVSMVVRDSAANYQDGLSPEFVVPDRADTLRTRFVRFEPAPPAPDSFVTVPQIATGSSSVPLPAVILSGPSDFPIEVRAYTASRPPPGLNATPTSGTVVRPQATMRLSGDGIAAVFPDRIEVVGQDTVYSARFALQSPDDLGSVMVTQAGLASLPSFENLWIELTLPSGDVLAETSQAGRFLGIGSLPPGPYRVRFFVDTRPWRDGEALQRRRVQWDGGSLAPYLPPDPLVVLAEPVEVRARWETEIEAALLAPLFDADTAAPAGTPPPAPER